MYQYCMDTNFTIMVYRDIYVIKYIHSYQIGGKFSHQCYSKFCSAMLAIPMIIVPLILEFWSSSFLLHNDSGVP